MGCFNIASHYTEIDDISLFYTNFKEYCIRIDKKTDNDSNIDLPVMSYYYSRRLFLNLNVSKFTTVWYFLVRFIEFDLINLIA